MNASRDSDIASKAEVDQVFVFDDLSHSRIPLPMSGVPC